MTKRVQVLPFPKLQTRRPNRAFLFRRLTIVTLLLFIIASSVSFGSMQNVYAQATLPNQVANTGRVAVVGVAATSLYATPGGELLQTLPPSTAVTVSGRSQDSQWVQAKTDDGSTGWLMAQQLIVFGVDELPVVGAATVTVENSTVITTTTAEPESVAVPMSTTITPETAITPTTAVTLSAPVMITVTEASTLTITAVTTRPASTITATVTASGSRLNVRTGPGATYAIVAKATSGQVYTAHARNADSDWIQILINADQDGWVAAQYVKLSAPVNELPLSTTISNPLPAQVAIPTTQVIAVESAQTEPVPIQTKDEPATQATALVPVSASQPTQASASAATGRQGTLVFQASQGGAIYVYQMASGAMHQLTHGFDPAISPDGSQVAFTRSGGENGLYLINIDGSNERKIFGERETLRSPKWSPDGNWIVFSEVPDTYQCYLMGQQCLTRTDLKKRFPNFAQDPDALDAFVADLDVVVNELWSLARVNVDGQEYRDIPALDSARTPDWSASGIVYQSKAGLQRTADGTDAENKVVIPDHYVQDPDWQPNGGRIVYQSRRGSHWEIFAVNDDGGGQVALTRPETALVDQLPSNVSPAWSPDGQYIVFLSNREENHEAGAWRIWVMNADGSNQHPLPINVTIDYTYTGEQMISWGN